MSENPGVAGRRAFVTAVGASAVALAGCSSRESTDESAVEADSNATHDASVGSKADALGYPDQRATGNRVVGGQGALPDGDFVDVGVSWTPAWVVGIPAGGGSRWALVGDAGEVVSVEIADGTASMARVTPDDLSLGVPRLFRGGDSPGLVTHRADDGAHWSPPVPVADGLLSVSSDGDLVLWDEDERDRLALDAPTDARIVTTADRAFVFADATGRYNHAVLGDSVEAGSLAVVDHRDGLSEVTRIRPEPAGSGVFEGLGPIVADLTGTNGRNVIVTESDPGQGARIVAFAQDGERLATGPALGSGWRHQLAVAPFGPGGRQELAAIRMPHVAQTAEFYRLTDGRLQVFGEASGYASHAMGSRNLDAGLAGDLDGDGRVELLVPTADRQALGGVRRTRDGAEGVWQVSLGGDLTTNIGAVNAGGEVTVAAGWDGTVRFWHG